MSSTWDKRAREDYVKASNLKIGDLVRVPKELNSSELSNWTSVVEIVTVGSAYELTVGYGQYRKIIKVGKNQKIRTCRTLKSWETIKHKKL